MGRSAQPPSEGIGRSEQAGVLSAAANSVGYLIGFQFMSRISTFLLNLFIVRRVAPELFGIGNFHLQLFLNIALLLSREGFRRAVTRYSLHPSKEGLPQKGQPSAQQLINLIWCIVPLGALISFGTALFFLWARSEEEKNVPDYATFIWMSCGAATLELMAEPFWIQMQMLFLIRQRVRIEGFAMITRCLIVFGGVFFLDLGLLSFVWGQLAFAVALLGGFIFYFHQETKIRTGSTNLPFTSLRQAFPRQMRNVPWSVVSLVGSFSWQALEKLILEESEKFVLKFTGTLLHQGVFSVVSSLGSLVARFLFQPVEEVCFALFSKLLSSQNDSERLSNLTLCARVLNTVLKLMVLVGLVFLCFGTNYSTCLLELLYGQSYGRASPAPNVLSVYCVFVCFMAVNGVTEAFFSAAANPADLRRHNIAMIAFSSVYVCSCIVLVRLYDTPGLVLANCLNMAARITYSIHFARSYFARSNASKLLSFRSALPHRAVLSAFLVSFLLTGLSESAIYDSNDFHPIPVAIHIAVGTLCLAVTVGISYLKEKEFLSQIRQLRGR